MQKMHGILTGLLLGICVKLKFHNRLYTRTGYVPQSI